MQLQWLLLLGASGALLLGILLALAPPLPTPASTPPSKQEPAASAHPHAWRQQKLQYECPFVQAALNDYLPVLSTLLLGKYHNLNPNQGLDRKFYDSLVSKLPETRKAYNRRYAPAVKLYTINTTENTEKGADNFDVPSLHEEELQSRPLGLVVGMVVYTLNNAIKAAQLNNQRDQSSSSSSSSKNHKMFVTHALRHRHNLMRKVHKTFDPVCQNHRHLYHCLVYYTESVHLLYELDDDILSGLQHHSTADSSDAEMPNYDDQVHLLDEMKTTAKWMLSDRTFRALENMDESCAKLYWRPSGTDGDGDGDGDDKSDINNTVATPAAVSPTVIISGKDGRNISIPIVGMGLGCSSFAEFRTIANNLTERTDQFLVEVIMRAIKLGVRFFDTAELYNNEELLGRAIMQSGVNRSEFIISTKVDDDKIPPGNVGADAIRLHVRDSVASSLRKLKTEYIDFACIHHHNAPDMSKAGAAADNESTRIEVAIRTLLELESEGVIRSLAPSQQIEDGQLPLKPFSSLRWHHEHSLFDPDRLSMPDLSKEYSLGSIGTGQLNGFPDSLEILGSAHVHAIAKRVQRTDAQVLFRWSLQTGVGVIPCTANKKRLEENSPGALLGFELDQTMMFRLGEMSTLLEPLNGIVGK